jgi:hypothetical protein
MNGLMFSDLDADWATAPRPFPLSLTHSGAAVALVRRQSAPAAGSPAPLSPTASTKKCRGEHLAFSYVDSLHFRR